MGANSSTIQDSRASVTTATPTLPAVYNPNHRNSVSNQNGLQARRTSASLGVPPSHSVRTAKIMTFHSKASWIGYLEASKAFTNLVVIHFTTAWYEPCRYMEPAFNALAASYTNVDFVKIDVDELHDISRQYGVQTTPTFMFMKRGKVIDKVDGARKEELQRKIEKHRS